MASVSMALSEQAIAMFWIVFNPAVSFIVFLCLAAVAVALRGTKDRLGKMAGVFACLFGAYAIFNVVDFFVYRNCGALAMSPVNQLAFQMLCPPDDLYEPYATAALESGKAEYEIDFCHKYGGVQEVCLVVTNDHPKEFDYDHPDVIGLSFGGCLARMDGPAGSNFEKSYDSYYLLPGQNCLELLSYRIDHRVDLAPTNRLTVKVAGDIAAFLRRYPGSHLSVRNRTVK